MTKASWSLTAQGPIAQLTFSRPPLHMISHHDVGVLEERLNHLVASGGTRVVILTGAGAGVFVRHADLDDLVAMADGRPTSGDPQAWIRVLRLLDRGPMLSIAAMNGQAWGGGLELALSCNLRLLDERASVCFPEAALGILPGVAAHRLIRMVPSHVALELLATGEPMDAASALRLGLVNGVVAAGTVVDAAHRLAGQIVRHPASAIDAVRSLVLDHRDDPERILRRRQSELWAGLAADDEARRRIDLARMKYLAGRDSEHALGVGAGG